MGVVVEAGLGFLIRSNIRPLFSVGEATGDRKQYNGRVDHNINQSHKANFNFSYELSFMNQFCVALYSHAFLLVKSSDHKSGLSLKPVTITAGDDKSFGIPQTTWIGCWFRSFCKTSTHGPLP